MKPAGCNGLGLSHGGMRVKWALLSPNEFHEVFGEVSLGKDRSSVVEIHGVIVGA